MSSPIQFGTTDVSVVLKVIDATTGVPDQALDYTDFALWYRREVTPGSTPLAVQDTFTEVTQTVTGAHADYGVVHLEEGCYRVDMPDAAFASGAIGVTVGAVITGKIVIEAYHPLVAYDPYDAVRMGMTALPNAAAEAAGGLIVSTAGTTDADDCVTATGFATPTNITAATGVVLSAAGNTAVIDEFETQSQADPTGFHVNVLEVGGTAQTANDIGGDVNAILLDTNELQTNQGDWATATGFATPTNITAGTITTVTNLTNLPTIPADWLTAAGTAADFTTEIQSGLATSSALSTVDGNVDAILVDTGTTLPASIATIDANVDTMVAGIITFTAQTGTLSTTQATTDLSGYTADQLIGRLITWTSGVCDGEQTDITDFVVTNGELTYTAMTLAPGNGDTGKIT